VLTLSGRRRILKGFDDKYTTRINTQVQGTAGDIAKKAISSIWREIVKLPGEAKLIAMIHDEIVLEVQEDVKEQWAQRLKDCMEQAGESVCSKVPIVAEVSYGLTWADAK
jgi:DNA polymerase-1